MARKFLYFIAGMIIIVIAGGFAMSIWHRQIAALVMVPTSTYSPQTPLPDNAYNAPSMWLARPGMGGKNPARWQPQTHDGQGMARPDASAPAPAPASKDQQTAGTAVPAHNPDNTFAVFFIHPTSYLSRAQWNAPLKDAESQDLARKFVQFGASPFNQASEIWAPKYRQAAIGAFLTDAPDAKKALDSAYSDVAQAYDFFLSSVDDDTPIVLAGHSQGSLHLLRLLREKIAGTPHAKRIAAIYAAGWPVSIEHDLPALGFPGCATARQSGCIMSWSTFAEPADPSDLLDVYDASTGFDGKLRKGSTILCTNPLTGSTNGQAPATANMGTLVPDDDFISGTLVPQSVPARCDRLGLLLIGDPPEMGDAVLPGNNYHVYDIPLFWKSLQEDVTHRVTAWHNQP